MNSSIDDFYNRIKDFIDFSELAGAIGAAADDPQQDMDWPTAFDLVFTQIQPEIHRLGFTLLWEDPDGSYRQDTLAYIEALETRAKKYASTYDSRYKIDTSDDPPRRPPEFTGDLKDA